MEGGHTTLRVEPQRPPWIGPGCQGKKRANPSGECTAQSGAGSGWVGCFPVLECKGSGFAGVNASCVCLLCLPHFKLSFSFLLYS